MTRPSEITATVCAAAEIREKDGVRLRSTDPGATLQLALAKNSRESSQPGGYPAGRLRPSAACRQFHAIQPCRDRPPGSRSCPRRAARVWSNRSNRWCGRERPGVLVAELIASRFARHARPPAGERIEHRVRTLGFPRAIDGLHRAVSEMSRTFGSTDASGVD